MKHRNQSQRTLKVLTIGGLLSAASALPSAAAVEDQQARESLDALRASVATDGGTASGHPILSSILDGTTTGAICHSNYEGHTQVLVPDPQGHVNVLHPC